MGQPSKSIHQRKPMSYQSTSSSSLPTSTSVTDDASSTPNLHQYKVLHQKGYDFMAGNPYIHTGYRLHYSISDLYKSIFQFHNETVNVWTHLIGSILFIGLIINFIVQQFSDSYLEVTSSTSKVPTWPLVVFMWSAVICLSCSATYHLFSAYSLKVFYTLSKLDYSGIAILIAGSNYPIIYYGFYCQTSLMQIYLANISILAITTAACMFIPAFSHSKTVWIRTTIFILLGLMGIFPLGHLIYKFGINDPHVTKMLLPLVLMGGIYIFGAVLYAARFPERAFPGKLDYLFNSHQIFHVCVVIAALVHYQSSIEYFYWRSEFHECPADQ